MKKNKILKIFVAIALLISIETSAIAATTGVVNVETVRVREEATTDSDIVKLVSIGDKITITGEEGNWYKVKVGKVVGYIRKDLLTVDGEIVKVDDEENSSDSNQQEPSNGETPTETPTETENPEEVPGETAGQETPSTQETPREENPNEVIQGDKLTTKMQMLQMETK